MRCRCRPFDRDTATAAAHFDADCSLGAIPRQRHGHKSLATFDRHVRRCALYRNGPPASLRLFDPTAQHAGVEPAVQRNRRYGYTRLLACPDGFRFEKWAMLAASPTADPDRLFRSVHVYTYRAY
jgi:hypothetical protein